MSPALQYKYFLTEYFTRKNRWSFLRAEFQNYLCLSLFLHVNYFVTFLHKLVVHNTTKIKWYNFSLASWHMGKYVCVETRKRALPFSCLIFIFCREEYFSIATKSFKDISIFKISSVHPRGFKKEMHQNTDQS